MLTDKREILHIKSYFSKHANEEIIMVSQNPVFPMVRWLRYRNNQGITYI